MYIHSIRVKENIFQDVCRVLTLSLEAYLCFIWVGSNTKQLPVDNEGFCETACTLAWIVGFPVAYFCYKTVYLTACLVKFIIIWFLFRFFELFQRISLSYDGQTGKLKSMKNLVSGVEIPVNMEIYYYDGHPGNCSDAKYQPSGAYVFRPNTSEAHRFVHTPGTSLHVRLFKLLYEISTCKFTNKLVLKNSSAAR